jgi:hypothetical protein
VLNQLKSLTPERPVLNLAKAKGEISETQENKSSIFKKIEVFRSLASGISIAH